ncbi:MAG: hypothetical protein EU539_01955 [Promethearchaeota archaeon]|nr:MAG: hypothetical protein EU539_01955 [Candidatus Lokiarchaeota archaeon]
MITALTKESNSMDALIDKLKEITGIKFEYYQRKFLEKRINFRINDLEFSSNEEYLNHLIENPQEINKFLEKFTINYTYFFRNYEIFEKLEKYLRIYVKSLKRNLRIWSAPCATGDEPYSIAIMLDKLKNHITNFPDYEIIASDIDPRAIEIAKIGIYGEYSLHEIPKFYIDKFFNKTDTPIGPKYSISNKIKNKVEFIEEDIIKGHEKKNRYDVILCRNFLIYLDKDSREKLFKTFENHLVEGGLLILGKTESIMNSKAHLKVIDNVDRFYVKNRPLHDFRLQMDKKISFNKTMHKKKIDSDKNELLRKENESKKVKVKENLEPNSLLRTRSDLIEDDNFILAMNKSEILERKEKELEKKEMQIMRRLNEIKMREEGVEKREIYLNQREILIGIREKEIKQRMSQIKLKEKEIINLEQKHGSLDNNKDKIDYKPTNDRVIKPNMKGELNLPVGHYALINLHDKNNESTKFSAYSVGAGIAIILKDEINKVYAMSHVSHPKARKPKKGAEIKSPHKFADSSFNFLLDNILYHGANRENLKAIIIGGSNDIYHQDKLHQKNIDAIKEVLYSNKIYIEKEFLGGICERSVLFDAENKLLYIKKIWEDKFRLM